MTLARILIEVAPAHFMRPPYNKQAEGGDWYYNEGLSTLFIQVIGDEIDDASFLFALHELVEAYLCRREGVTQKAVDEFDWTHFLDDHEELGDHTSSPYRTQHRRAMLVEHLVAHFLGLTDYGIIR